MPRYDDDDMLITEEDIDNIDDITDDDLCYECSGLGDDYFINEEGEMECACPTCPIRLRMEDDLR